MSIELRAPYEDLAFMSPLSEWRAGQLIDFIIGGKPELIQDLGCGWGELLLRAVDGCAHAGGLDIDQDSASIERAVALAHQRGLGERVQFRVGDAAADESASDVLICIGASQIWAPVTQDPQPVEYARALRALRARLSRGSRAVYGEAIWSLPPTSAATAPLAGRPDELIYLADLVDLAVTAGFVPHFVQEADQNEWDEFESGYAACYARWLAEHAADDPDAARVRELAGRQRDGYLRGYRGIMGFAYLGLIAV